MAISTTALADAANSFLFTDSANGATIAGIKASSAVVYAIDVDNSANAAKTYVKLYNVASSSVTVGTTDPAMVIPIPANERVPIPIPAGLTFSDALSVASVTAGGTAGATSPTSNVTVRIVYV